MNEDQVKYKNLAPSTEIIGFDWSREIATATLFQQYMSGEEGAHNCCVRLFHHCDLQFNFRFRFPIFWSNCPSQICVKVSLEFSFILCNIGQEEAMLILQIEYFRFSFPFKKNHLFCLTELLFIQPMIDNFSKKGDPTSKNVHQNLVISFSEKNIL